MSAREATTPARVATNGIELAYEERGDGEPLVLIMGLGADRSAWEPHLVAYEQHFRCFAVDNRGVGASDSPAGPYSTAQMADDYAGLIEGLGLGSVRIVGISMGGAIAQELALRHPQLVERMVLVATWARCDAYTREVFEHFAAVRPSIAPADFVRLLQLWIWAPEYVDVHLAELQADRTTGTPMVDHAFAAQCAACVGHDALERLGELDLPTLITAGDRDIFIPLTLAEELHRAIPDAELQVFPGAAHAHHWERLDEFNARTTTWLA
jgi:pimeloyl-ACP methyl ester carboxylesterase